jgi:hypothetical protein
VARGSPRAITAVAASRASRRSAGAPTDGRVVLANLLAIALLVAGGFATARALAGAAGGQSKSSAVRVITTRQKVRVKVHGHVLTRWRTRKLYAEAKNVMRTQTIQTPHGITVLKRRVTRYQVVYRKGAVRTLTNTSTRTQLVTVP